MSTGYLRKILFLTVFCITISFTTISCSSKLEQAQSLAGNKKFKEAVKKLGQISKSDKDYEQSKALLTEYLLQEAQALADKNNYKDAAEVLGTIDKTDMLYERSRAMQSEYLFKEADLEAQRHNYDDAISQLNNITSSDNNYTLAQIQISKYQVLNKVKQYFGTWSGETTNMPGFNWRERLTITDDGKCDYFGEFYELEGTATPHKDVLEWQFDSSDNSIHLAQERLVCVAPGTLVVYLDTDTSNPYMTLRKE